MQLLPEQVRQLLVQLHRVVVVLVRVDVLSDRDHGTGRPREFLAQDIEIHDIEHGGLIPHLDHVSLEVGESVGDRLSEIDFVFVIIELVDETQREIVLEALSQVRVVIEKHVVAHGLVGGGGRLGLLGSGFSRNLVLEILHIIFTTPEPLAIILFLGLDTDLHA